MFSPKPASRAADVKFREFEDRDFPWLCKLDAMCFSPEIAYPPEEIAAALLQAGTFAIVAEHGEEVMAFILASRMRRAGHIVTIDVHPEWRGCGVGTELMRMAEARLAAQSAQRAVLEVGTSNAAAIAFYRKHGYGGDRLLRRYYPDGSDAYRMEKPL